MNCCTHCGADVETCHECGADLPPENEVYFGVYQNGHGVYAIDGGLEALSSEQRQSLVALFRVTGSFTAERINHRELANLREIAV